jgi:hypothetical protein
MYRVFTPSVVLVSFGLFITNSVVFRMHILCRISSRLSYNKSITEQGEARFSTMIANIVLSVYEDFKT